MLIIEDAHWLDADTAEVLSFVARRVEMEPIAALLELPHAAASERFHDSSLLSPVPITDTLERAFSDRASALPPATRTALLVGALDAEGNVTELLEAASAVTGAPVIASDLSPAEAAGLIEVNGTGLRFRHPLVRAAIDRAAPMALKRATHRALAEAYTEDLDRRAWHRAAACEGPDPQVVAELQGAAARALRRGAPALAAAALERGAELTAEATVQGNLLLRAAETEFELGRADLARRLLARARPLDLDDDKRAELTLMLEAADADSWSGPSRVASIAALASRMVEHGDPERALRGFLPVARSCWWGNAAQPTRDLVVDAVERLEVPEDHPARLAILACTDPVKRGAHVLDRIARMHPDPASDPAAMHLAGTAATAAWGFDLSLPFLSLAVDGLRAQGRLGLLAQALVSQSYAAMHVAKATLAESAADEAARLARETGQPRWAVAADLVRAILAGERGDLEAVERIAGPAEAELLPIGAQAMLALVQFARGRGAVAHQRYAEGFDHLRRALDPSDIGYHPFVGSWGLSDLIEAAVHIGADDEAATLLAELEALTATTSGPYVRATLAYTRPLAAPDEKAEELYQAALGNALVSWPCFRTRALLAYGRWLRRQRRVAESRAPLRAARESAHALGFGGLAETARQELRASGETSRQRTPDLRDQLTPQELQIAELVAEGLSNREIGQRLYLSHRTVGSHLYRMFPKLGITSRAQIAEPLSVLSPR